MATDYIQKFVTFFSATKKAEAKKKAEQKAGTNPESSAAQKTQTGVSSPIKGDIFSFAEKFASMTNGGKVSSIFAGSIKDLDDLDLSGDSVAFESKKLKDASGDGAEGAPKGKNSELYKTLEKMYNDPTFAAIIDKDGDKKITDEEAKEFIKALCAMDGKKDEFSAEDIKLFMEKAKVAFLEKERAEIEQAKLQEELKMLEETPASQWTPYTSQIGGMSPFSPSGWTSSIAGRGGSYAPMQPPKSLETQKEELQHQIEAYKAELAEINSGEQAAVKEAVKAEKKAKGALDEQLKKDEAVSQELKNKLAEVNQNISSKKAAISQKTTEISTNENELSQGENRLSVLKSALSSLAQPSGKPEDADKDAKINARKQELQQQIAEQERRNKELTDQIAQAKSDKEKLEGELSELEKERTSVEAEISKGASPETKQAMEEYKKAQQNIDVVKRQETSRVQDNLNAAQKDMNKLDSQLEVKKNKQAEGSSAEAALAYALNFNGKSEGEMAALMRSMGYSYHNGAWCADFVNFATGMSGIQRPDWYENCSNKSYCPTIESAGRAAGAAVALQDAKPGDLVMFDFNGQGESHHIGIFHSANADGTINVMEGNTRDAAMLRRRRVGTVSSILSMTA